MAGAACAAWNGNRFTKRIFSSAFLLEMQVIGVLFSRTFWLINIQILTRSWSVYHCGCGLSKTMPCKLMVTSPRKSFRPNISECHTVNHNVRVSKLFNGIKYLSVSSNTGFSVCFRTFVLRLPFFDLSGSK